MKSPASLSKMTHPLSHTRSLFSAADGGAEPIAVRELMFIFCFHLYEANLCAQVIFYVFLLAIQNERQEELSK